MKGTIKIKGTGFVQEKPDLVEVRILLESLDMDYGKAYAKASEKNEELLQVIQDLGFPQEELKTSYFDIDKKYEDQRDSFGNYKERFEGYRVTQRLKLAFDWDSQKLAEVLQALSQTKANPDLSIHFTVKDPSLIQEKLLESAAKNARRKAEVLAQASGVELGSLTRIDYDWDEVNFYSNTSLSSGPMLSRIFEGTPDFELEPEDLKLRDTVRFIWKIDD